MEEKKVKRIILLTVLLSMLVVPVTAGTNLFQLAKVDYPIFVDGQALESELPTLNYNGNTYLPLRKVAEAANSKVFWDNSNKAAYITSNNIAAAQEPLSTYTPQPTYTPRPTQTPYTITRTVEVPSGVQTITVPGPVQYVTQTVTVTSPPQVVTQTITVTSPPEMIIQTVTVTSPPQIIYYTSEPIYIPSTPMPTYTPYPTYTPQPIIYYTSIPIIATITPTQQPLFTHTPEPIYTPTPTPTPTINPYYQAEYNILTQQYLQDLNDIDINRIIEIADKKAELTRLGRTSEIPAATATINAKYKTISDNRTVQYNIDVINLKIKYGIPL